MDHRRLRREPASAATSAPPAPRRPRDLSSRPDHLSPCDADESAGTEVTAR